LGQAGESKPRLGEDETGQEQARQIRKSGSEETELTPWRARDRFLARDDEELRASMTAQGETGRVS